MQSVTGSVAAGLTLPVDVLMKSAPAAIARSDARRTLSYVAELAGLEDHLQVRDPARLLDADDLVDDLRVAAREERAPVDHHVDLVGAERHGIAHVCQLDVDRRLARRKRGRDGGDPHARAGEPPLGDAHEVRVDAHCRNGRDRAVGWVGVDRLRAQRGDLAGRVGTLERRQIHHPDREVERRKLRALLDRSFRELPGAGLERDRVDRTDTGQPEVERKLELARQEVGGRHRGKSSPRRFLVSCTRGHSRYRVARMALGAKTKLDLIKHVPLFEQCSKKDLQNIAQIADELDLREGKVLIQEGERGREFFVIVDGEVEVRRKGRRVATLGAGDFVGEMALLSKVPRSATVTALTPVDVLVITDRAFLDLLDRMPELWLKVARALAERVGADETGDGR